MIEFEIQLLKAPEAAKMLRISRAGLYKLNAEGRLPPPVKIGHVRRWRTADLQAVIDGTWPPSPRA